MTVVKICGIQRPEDALIASEAGADFIGLVFVPGRRRCRTREQASEILAAIRQSVNELPDVVGLFADQPLEQVNEYVQDSRLDAVQLCGSESLEYCEQVQARVFKVIHVPAGAASEQDLAALRESLDGYSRAGHLVTLDRQVEGLQGGTGESFDWKIAAGLAAAGHKFLLAGGLTPDNVGDAVRLVKPWGVDVSSGVETAGAKDAAKIRAFVEKVRSVP